MGSSLSPDPLSRALCPEHSPPLMLLPQASLCSWTSLDPLAVPVMNSDSSSHRQLASLAGRLRAGQAH